MSSKILASILLSFAVIGQVRADGYPLKGQKPSEWVSEAMAFLETGNDDHAANVIYSVAKRSESSNDFAPFHWFVRGVPTGNQIGDKDSFGQGYIRNELRDEVFHHPDLSVPYRDLRIARFIEMNDYPPLVAFVRGYLEATREPTPLNAARRIFLLKTFLHEKNGALRPYLDAVLDNLIAQPHSQSELSRVAEEVVKAHRALPMDQDPFRFIDPFNKKLSLLLPDAELRKAMVRPFLNGKHQYFVHVPLTGAVKKDTYSSLLSSLKSLGGTEEYVQELNQLSNRFLEAAPRDRLDKTGAPILVLQEYAETIKTHPELSTKKSEFTEFVRAKVFDAKILSNTYKNTNDLEFLRFARELKQIDTGLGVDSVFAFFDAKPNRLFPENESLVELLVDSNPAITQSRIERLTAKIPDFNVAKAYRLKLREKYIPQPVSLPKLDPDVGVPKADCAGSLKELL